MRAPPELRCGEHLLSLGPEGAEVDELDALPCEKGCRVRVVGGIPRFVSSSGYASGFGLQWNAFRRTQLDSHTGTTISRDRLTRCLGASLDVLAGKTVLEVGCGAGRFTELMLKAGARVVACDLSEAVEANYENCRSLSTVYFVCQADVRRLPFPAASFDFVVCLGVIEATPDPEETMAALARQVRPGGTLVIDHYSHDYPMNFARRSLRRMLLRLSPRVAKAITMTIGRALLPFHRLSWSEKRGRWRIRRLLRRVSPLVDYYNDYPQLGRTLLSEWALLDTHDTLTDYYKHLRSAGQIAQFLTACGLESVEVSYGGNGVEARARVPLGRSGS